MSGPDHRCPDCGVVDGCVCGPDDGPLVIPCLRPAGECRDAIAALTSELADARAERVMFCALVESLQAELAEARRMLGEAVEVQEDLAGKLFDAVRERDALRAGKWAGAWEPMESHHNGEGYFRGLSGGSGYAVAVGRRRDGLMDWRSRCANNVGRALPTADAAKAAADAHLIAAGWWLENGAFTGESK